MDNWDNIRFFLAVARAGTVSAAATELAVSHATVLRRVEQFEQSLGVKVFRRLQSGYQLSEAGEAMLLRAAKVEQQALALSQEFSDRDRGLAGTLRVSQPESHVIDLYPLYQKFIEAYPDIELEIQASQRSINLNRRQADVAIRIISEPDDSLVGRKIGRVYFGAYCSRNYLQKLQSLSAGGGIDWQHAQWIIWRAEAGINAGNAHFEWLQRHLQQPKIVMQTSSVADVINACRASIGIGLISRTVAAQYPELVEVRTPVKTSWRHLWLLYHRDVRELSRLKCFNQFMVPAVKELLSSKEA